MSNFLLKNSVMKLSKKGEYALRALIALGLAASAGDDLLTIGELAREQHIPESFLQVILFELKAAGVVVSLRGKAGGFRLGLPPEAIVVGDIVRRLDGPLAPIRCVSLSAYEKCSCPDEANCGLRNLVGRVRDAISDILDRTTLADLIRGKCPQTPAVAQPPASACANGSHPAIPA